MMINRRQFSHVAVAAMAATSLAACSKGVMTEYYRVDFYQHEAVDVFKVSMSDSEQVR